MAKQTSDQVNANLTAALGGNVTQEQLDAWKASHKKVHIVTVKIDGNKTLTGYYKKAARDVVANCVNMAHSNQVFEAREFLANNTFLGGDAEMQTNEDAAMSAQVILWKSVNFLPAEVTTY